MNSCKDLTKEAPRSPRVRVGGYILLGRMLDKGRALLNSTAGAYLYDGGLDRMLLEFKGVTGDQVKALSVSGASDEEVAAWLDTQGTPKTPEEIKKWGDSIETFRPYDHPEKKEWFSGECVRIRIDPARVTMVEWLEADDRASFGK